MIESLCYHLLSLILCKVFFFNSDFSLTLLPVALRKDLYYFLLSVCLKAVSIIRLIIDQSSKERNLCVRLSLRNSHYHYILARQEGKNLAVFFCSLWTLLLFLRAMNLEKFCFNWTQHFRFSLSCCHSQTISCSFPQCFLINHFSAFSHIFQRVLDSVFQLRPFVQMKRLTSALQSIFVFTSQYDPCLIQNKSSIWSFSLLFQTASLVCKDQFYSCLHGT